MNIVLIGIQGSGKGTQARLIKEKYSYSFFEMGQKLRNFCTLGLPESFSVKKCIDSGELVPLELTGKILTHYRETHKENFIIFDGIPRALDQKEMFDLIIDEYVVFNLEITEKEAIRRLAGRRIDPETGDSFPPEYKGDTNPKTGNKLVVRDDDNEESVKRRIKTFFSNTKPLLKAWKEEGKKIYNIDSGESPEKTFAQIDEIISNDFYKSI